MKYPETEKREADVLSAFDPLPLGCNVKNGVLEPALSPVKISDNCPYPVTGAFYSGIADKFFVCTGGKIYSSANCIAFSSEGNFAAENPSCVEERNDKMNMTVIFGDENYLVVTESGNIVMYNADTKSSVLKNGRRFGIGRANPYKIFWSAGDMAIDSAEGINGAGWTYSASEYGKILNLAKAGDNLIALHEYGLAVFSAYGSPENFRLVKSLSVPESVRVNTAAATDGKVVFASGDKIYIFDGEELAEAEFTLKEDFSAPTRAILLNGRYFVSGYSEKLARRAVLMLEITTGMCSLIDVAADAFAVKNNRIYAFSSDGVFRLESGGFTFISEEVDFGVSGQKVLDRLEIKADRAVDAEVSNGVKTRILRGVNGFVRLNMRGERFKIKITGEARVYKVFARAEVRSGI